jgi:hypothetical protein
MSVEYPSVNSNSSCAILSLKYKWHSVVQADNLACTSLIQVLPIFIKIFKRYLVKNQDIINCLFYTELLISLQIYKILVLLYSHLQSFYKNKVFILE